jgi:hypothetical protein
MTEETGGHGFDLSEPIDARANSCIVSCMATKTISLELDAYVKLRQAKREGESFSAVVRRARFGPADATGRSILAALDTLEAREVDREAVVYWEREGGVEKARTTSQSAWEEVDDAS